MRGFDQPVGVDHSGGLLEDRLDLRSDSHPPRCIRSVDFRDERLQHGWARRRLRHLDSRAELLRDRHQPLPHAASHIVALRRAFALRHEIHLQIGEVRSAPQKVVPHEAVEVVGRRDADVLLDADDRFIVQDR